MDKALYQLGDKASNWLVFHSALTAAVWRALEQREAPVSVTPVIVTGETQLYRLSRPAAEMNKPLALRPGDAGAAPAD